MLRIRKATSYDLTGIYHCAERFFEYAGYVEKFNLPLDETSFRQMVSNYIENGICYVLVEGDQVRGGICGIVVPWGFNQNIKVCMELFYWVDEDCRGVKSIKLIDTYEKAVKELGAKNVMIQPETELSDKVGLLYKRRGYVPLESLWIKGDI